MTSNLLDFAVLVSLQLIIFSIYAYKVGEKDNIGKYLKQGMLLGLPFGVVFDLVIGKYFGLFTYVLGYDLWFLIINGIFSYGFMITNVILFRKYAPVRMYISTACLGLTYETMNHFWPVWEFTFATPLAELVSVVFVLYIGLAWLMMVALQLVFKNPFRLVPFGKNLS